MRTALVAAVVLAAAPAARAADPDIKSISALAFGPNGLLFVGDSTGAQVVAVETGDVKQVGDKDVTVERLDAKLAGLVGATEKDIRVTDIKVNPASGNVYVAAARGTTPALFRVVRGTNAVEPVALKDVKFTTVALTNASEKQRGQTITSMAFVDGRLVVAGLSNEEFASTLRAIPYPFKDGDKGAGIEIFHGAHNKVETQAPIRTFTTYKVGGEDNIMAAYTCTPLVRIPMSDLKAGAKVKGTTIAELGSGNQPLDMVTYTKDGKDYVLLANSKRGVMKIAADQFAGATAITAKPATPIAGVKYDTIAELKDVAQLDKLDGGRVVLLVTTAAGSDLKTVPMP